MLSTIKNIFLLFFCQVLLSTSILAQKEANIWYFGDHAGLDFNSGHPVALIDGEMSTLEGCATISDVYGKLLFYTNGIIVWNRDHQIMTNGTGLLGHFSSSHSGVIIPKPGSNTVYYIFTVEEIAKPNGINYSEVDMTMSGGLGAVTVKNIPMLTPTQEKLTAVRHATQNAYWVIMHGFPDNTFYSYLVTSAGVSSTPVTSSCGVIITNPNNCRGSMKVSPDGHKLALAYSWADYVELFDFDNATGKVSNPITFSGFIDKAPYGVEFSPSGQLLYVGEWYLGTYIYQYDLNAPDIAASRTIIGWDAGNNIGALQLGPDGKIYVAVENSKYLGVINNPDILGSGCSFVLSGISLAGRISLLGLPTFIQTYFMNADFSFNNACKGEVTHFTSNAKNFDSLHWDFGDSLSGANNFSDSANPSHKYPDKGNFTISLTVYAKDKKVTYVKTAAIKEPEIDLGKDTIICPGKLIILNASTPDATYKWQDSSVNASYQVTQAGTYWVVVTHKCGIIKDTINVYYKSLPPMDIGAGKVLCLGDTMLLDATVPNGKYLWQDYSNMPTYHVYKTGKYKVIVTVDGCTVMDSVNIIFIPVPNLNLGNDTSICDGEVFELNAIIAGSSYRWQDSSTQSTYKVTQKGLYIVKVTNICGTMTDSININFKPWPIVNLGNDTIICEGSSIILKAYNKNATYNWQDHTLRPVYVVTQPGIYTVKVNLDGCIVNGSIDVGWKKCDPDLIIPNVFTPNNDQINDTFQPVVVERVPTLHTWIYDRWGILVFQSDKLKIEWDGKLSDGHPASNGTYFWIIEYTDISKHRLSMVGTVSLFR